MIGTLRVKTFLVMPIGSAIYDNGNRTDSVLSFWSSSMCDILITKVRIGSTYLGWWSLFKVFIIPPT